MKILVTGINGFAGSHLAELLLREEPDAEIHGTIRLKSSVENILHIKEFLELIAIDIRDPHSVMKTISLVQPDFIFHLAAQTFVPFSWSAPNETIETNVLGTINLLEAVRHSFKNQKFPKILVAGSSEEYGLVSDEELPITENNPLRPLSPYGVSKVAQDQISWQYFKSYGLPIIISRAFNHTGPRRPIFFSVSSFCYQAAKSQTITHGNLEAIRDFTDVRDTVRAYYLLMKVGTPGERYNICTGRGIKISEIIETLSQLTESKINTILKPALSRPSDVPRLVGDYSKLYKKTGWTPKISFHKTVKDCYDYWCERTKKGEIKNES